MSDLSDLEIPGHLCWVEGEMPKVRVQTRWSSAEIYLQGAQVTHFQKNAEPPLLFMSRASQFTPGTPIRGGIPIIFPWFGAREGFPAHGFARSARWSLEETTLLASGAVHLRFRLPPCESWVVELVVTVAASLTLELRVSSTAEQELTFATCLHTYFQISAIDAIEVRGLSGVSYFDQLSHTTLTESADTLKIAAEIDRIYSDSPAALEIVDPGYGRKLRLETQGSNSTVVWNPWLEKSKQLKDFGDDEYLQMVCVESGNLATQQIILPPGGCAVLRLELSSVALN